MTKKILIVTECFYPEEFKINDVALSWKNKGYDVDVLTLSPTYPLGEIFPGYKNKLFSKGDYHGIGIYRLFAVTGYKKNTFKKILKYINFMILGSLFSIFIGRKYDYVLGFNMSALTGMLPVVVLKKLFRKPILFWTQDIWPESVYAYGFKKTKILSASLEFFVRFIYKSSSNIAISGKGFEQKLKPYVQEGTKFHYIPNWADDLDETFDSIKLSKVGITNFTFAGNIGKVQNLEIIIDAFLLIPSETKNKAQLNIIGDGSNLELLKKRAEKCANIVFYGKIPRLNMAKYYKVSDFLIVSLIDDPVFSAIVPAKFQTYIAAKKPILAVINGETANLVDEYKLGLSVPPNKVDSISEGFMKCVEMDESERKLFINENEKLLNSTFNKNKIIDKLLNIMVKNCS